MIKKLWVFVLGASINTASYGSEVMPAMMFFQGIKTEEKSIVANSALRCSALLNILGGVMERDTGKLGVAERLRESSQELLLLSAVTELSVKKDRGIDQNIESFVSDSVSRLEPFHVFYVDRITKNQISSGEMFAGDVLIQDDIESCPMILQLLKSDEWTATLDSGDWSVWKGMFADDGLGLLKRRV